MHTTLYLAALASVAYSQLINLDAIALDFSPPELVKAPLNVESDIPVAPTADAIIPLQSVSAKKRELIEKRDGDCSPYPAGSGPVPNPDTPSAFLSDPDFATMANNAPTPDGYALAFSNLSASLQASNYMGLYTLTSYDTLTCASKCDQANCSAFNVYLERDPTLNASAQNCPNPPSTTNFKCTLWGAPVSPDEATNSGQYQSSFHVVIAGSNGYNKKSPPPPVSCYSGPQELGGAINAPPSTGSYMGYQYFPFSQSQGYDPQTCADACDAQTAYDSRHPAADGSFMSCKFFNAYVLSKNAIPQGLYCSMYNETWDPSYGTNYGQYRGSDRYTVSESYSYSKTCGDTNPPPISSISSSIPVSSATSRALSSFSSATSSISSSSAATTLTSVWSSIKSPSTPSSATQTASPTSFISSSAAVSSGPSSSTLTSISSVPSLTTTPPSSTSASGYIPNETCDPVPNNLVLNGLFWCGLAPWVVNYWHLAQMYPVQNPIHGFEYYGSGGYVPHSGQSPGSVSQQISVTPGQAYTLTFQTYFDHCSGQSTIDVSFGNDVSSSISDCRFAVGQPHDNTINFVASGSTAWLTFNFIDTAYYSSGSQEMIVGNVALVPASPQSTSSLPSTTSSAVASATSGCNTNSPVIQNGGFESGTLSPWSASAPSGGVSGATQSITQPGSTLPGGGTYAFYGLFLRTPANPDASTQYLSQKMNTCAGATYNVTADYVFLDYSCSISITGNVTVTSPVDGKWHRMSSTFTAGTNADYFFVTMTCLSGRLLLDSVNVTKISP